MLFSYLFFALQGFASEEGLVCVRVNARGKVKLAINKKCPLGYLTNQQAEEGKILMHITYFCRPKAAASTHKVS